MADVEYFKSSFPKIPSGWPSPMASDWVASSLGRLEVDSSLLIKAPAAVRISTFSSAW